MLVFLLSPTYFIPITFENTQKALALLIMLYVGDAIHVHHNATIDGNLKIDSLFS